MKLSNKILIGFFGFVFLYMTAAFTEFKLRGTPHHFTVITNVQDSATVVETSAVYTQSYTDIEKGFSIDLLPDCQIVNKDDKHVEISVPSVEGTLNIFWPRHGEYFEYKDLEHMSNFLAEYKDDTITSHRTLTLGPFSSEEDGKFKIVVASQLVGESRTYLLHFIGTDNGNMMQVRGMLNTLKVIEPAK